MKNDNVTWVRIGNSADAESLKDPVYDGHSFVNWNNVSKGVAMVVAPLLAAGALAGAAWMAYDSDRQIDRDSDAKFQQVYHEALVIPQLEAQHNYRLAEKYENQGWSFLGDCKRNKYRITPEHKKLLTNLLNNNNTQGALRNEPLN